MPETPVSPNVPRNIGTSLLLGLLLGVGFAFFGSRLDRTVKSIESVEALGVKVLGVIPNLNDVDPEGTKARPDQGEQELSSDETTHDLLVQKRPMSAAAESFRMIRTNLAFMSPEKPLRSLVVTSAHPREGKTTVATQYRSQLCAVRSQGLASRYRSSQTQDPQSIQPPKGRRRELTSYWPRLDRGGGTTHGDRGIACVGVGSDSAQPVGTTSFVSIQSIARTVAGAVRLGCFRQLSPQRGHRRRDSWPPG